MKQKITQRTVKYLTAHQQGNRIIWDLELKGFGVRITSAGVITFILNYRSHGRQRRYKIGRAPEWTAEAARTEAAELKPRIDKGFDPLEAKRKARGEPTLSDLAEEYLKTRQDKSASTRRNDEQALAHIVLPRFGKLRLAAVNTRDIEILKSSLEATPYRANRVLALLSHMFTKAIEWKWAKENPVRGVTRYHEEKKERWLSEEELGVLKKALDTYRDQSAANCIRLLMLTGSREGEALNADWSQFDLRRGIWTKPSHHTKQKKTEHVPLSEETLTLLRSMKPADSGPLFPGKKKAAGKSEAFEARTTLRNAWKQICKAAGLAERYEKKGKRRTLIRWRPLVRIHDLRHTFASHLVSNGTSLQIVGKLIGHTQIATTMRYAHLADGALRDATNNFGKIFTTAKPPEPEEPTQKVVGLPNSTPARKRAAGKAVA